mmetsp:Transcript_4137/g.9706  ORF Transcript_4137/g.9706 Transcript_4137/m.9706 type:complete len:241 (-) Transcript_4137:1306-2028(-)
MVVLVLERLAGLLLVAPFPAQARHDEEHYENDRPHGNAHKDRRIRTRFIKRLRILQGVRVKCCIGCNVEDRWCFECCGGTCGGVLRQVYIGLMLQILHKILCIERFTCHFTGAQLIQTFNNNCDVGVKNHECNAVHSRCVLKGPSPSPNSRKPSCVPIQNLSRLLEHCRGLDASESSNGHAGSIEDASLAIPLCSQLFVGGRLSGISGIQCQTDSHNATNLSVCVQWSLREIGVHAHWSV